MLDSNSCILIIFVAHVLSYTIHCRSVNFLILVLVTRRVRVKVWCSFTLMLFLFDSESLIVKHLSFSDRGWNTFMSFFEVTWAELSIIIRLEKIFGARMLVQFLILSMSQKHCMTSWVLIKKSIH